MNLLRRGKHLAVSIVLALSGSLTMVPSAFAAADACTWTGAVNANWSEGGNWSGCDNGGVPENGDSLIFPAGGLNTATTNDMTNLQVAGITINGAGYTIAGNTFTITSVVAVIATESATITASVNYNSGSNMNLYAASGKTLTLSGTSNFTVTGIYEVNIGSGLYSGTVDFSGNITGTSGEQFIAVGGKAIVRGSTNNFTSTDVGAEGNGIFECRSANCFGATANKIYTGGGTVDIFASTPMTYANGFETSTSTPDDSQIKAHGSVTILGNGSVSDALTLSELVSGQVLRFDGTIANTAGISTAGSDPEAAVYFGGNMSGSGNINVTSGVAYLTGNNTFTGRVDIADEASVLADSSNALGASSTGTYVANGGSLVFNATSALNSAEPLFIAGDGNSNSTALYSASTANVTLTGAITLNDDAAIGNLGMADFNINGVISGSHNLTLSGGVDGYNDPGILLGGTSANTYTGMTTVTGGGVYGTKTTAIPGNLTLDSDTSTSSSAVFYVDHSDAIADNAVVTLTETDDNFVVNTTTPEVIGGLQGSTGQVSLDSNTNLVVNQSFDSTFGGNFDTDGQAATFTKRGSGTLTLSGTDLTPLDQLSYVVEGGTLSLNGMLRTTNGGNVTVQSGGVLKGVGTIGAATVNAGGVLAPGNSPGTMNVTNLTLTSGGVHQVEIASDSSYDRVIATGAVSLGGASLQLVPGYTPANGQVFTIITGASVAGTFSGLPNGAEVTANGLRFRVNYTATSVTLTFVSGELAGVPNTGLLHIGTLPFAAAVALGAFLIVIARAIVRQRRYARQ